MRDPFIGTWQLNPRKSAFGQNHQPTAGTMVTASANNRAQNRRNLEFTSI